MANRCVQRHQCWTYVLSLRTLGKDVHRAVNTSSVHKYKHEHTGPTKYCSNGLHHSALSLTSGKYVSRLAQWTHIPIHKRQLCNAEDPQNLSRHNRPSKRISHTRGKVRDSVLYVGSLDEGPAIVEVDLALEERLAQQETLAENIVQRGMGIDLNSFIKKYKKYKSLEKEKLQLEAEQDSISDVMKVVVKDKTPKGKEDKALLIKKGRAAKEKVKAIMKPFHELEKEVMLEALHLPNDIHPSTPKESYVQRFIGPEPDKNAVATSHMVLGKELGILRFLDVSPGAYYMMGELAVLEMDLTWHITDLMTKAGYEQFACPDTVKTIVMEGCGADYLNPDQTFLIEQRGEKEAGATCRLHTQHHLCGVSPAAFAAYFTKMNIGEKHLPMRCFTIGRSYSPNCIGSTDDYGLMAASQTNKLELFGASSSLDQSELLLEEFSTSMDSLFSEFDLSFRCVQVGAKHLEPQEMCRVDYQVWMPSFSDYFTVGNVSLWGDFFSRRLMTKFSTDPNEIVYDNFIFTTHCTGLNLQVLLAALMEKCQDQIDRLHLNKIWKSK